MLVPCIEPSARIAERSVSPFQQKTTVARLGGAASVDESAPTALALRADRVDTLSVLANGRAAL